MINDLEYEVRSVLVAGWRAQDSEIDRDVRRLIVERVETRQLHKNSERPCIAWISDSGKAKTGDRRSDRVDRVSEDASHFMPLAIS